MISRRSFFQMGGLLGGLTVSGLAGAAVGTQLLKENNQKTIKQIEELASSFHTIRFTQKYGELIPVKDKHYVSFGHQFKSGTEKTATVTMTPGPDGEMYLRINGEWRKIVTEI